ncbi:MAG: DUF4390 domain-containing protein [Rhodocyclaceae bacterium]|nr:DUF4390 domain-containing protein [Rhodocyclaceae bacterium]
MMGFTTRCWRKRLSQCAAGTVALLWALLALAGAIEPKSVKLEREEGGLVLDADFAIDLGPRLSEAVRRGVPLEFRLEFTLARKRWYWIDEHLASRVLRQRLSFNALTRQYRVTTGGFAQNFATLEEALAALARVRRWPVAEKIELAANETYLAALRLSLDHGLLPKPLQVDALADREWRIEAKTSSWSFTLADLP